MKKSRRETIAFHPSMLSPQARAVREQLAKLPPSPTPPTVRECLAQGLLPYGLRSDRGTMSPAHMRQLVERYPGLYRHADDAPVSSCEPFAREGFACGDGWFAIISRLSAVLTADSNLAVGQLKEKMGLLTVYFDVSESARPEIEAATDAALDQAREESGRTCEMCGMPGVRKARGHHISALCEPCEWLDEIEEACRRLTDCVEGMDLSAFLADESCLDAARRHVQHLGEAASHQSAERRARLPGVNWERLDSLRAVTGALAMSPGEIWSFIRNEGPVLAEALR